MAIFNLPFFLATSYLVIPDKHPGHSLIVDEKQLSYLVEIFCQKKSVMNAMSTDYTLSKFFKFHASVASQTSTSAV